MSCPPDQELQAGLCYPNCRDGYTGLGPICWQTCPPDFNDAGFVCMKPNYSRGEGTAPIVPSPQPITAPVVAPGTTALESITMPQGIPIWVWIIIGILILLVIALGIAFILKRCPPTYPAIGITGSYRPQWV